MSGAASGGGAVCVGGEGGTGRIIDGGGTGRQGGAECFAVVWHPVTTRIEPTKTARAPTSLIDIERPHTLDISRREGVTRQLTMSETQHPSEALLGQPAKGAACSPQGAFYKDRPLTAFSLKPCRLGGAHTRSLQDTQVGMLPALQGGA